MNKPVKIVLGCAGALVVLVIVVTATGFYMVRSALQSETVTAEQATAAFDEVRQKFPGVRPAFTFDERGPELVRDPPSSAPPQAPSTVHILLFDPAEKSLTRIHLPMALLRLGNSPARFNGVELKMEDIERYGSTVLIDGDTPEGEPILIWTD